MAKLTRQKARKEYECCKCKKMILKGDIYQKIVERYREPKTVCQNCVVPRSELTGSEYLSWLFDLQDNFEIESFDDIESLIENIEEQKDELEEKLSNIPEQFQDGEAATILQDRIDCLYDAICELEQIDLEDFDEKTEEEKQNDLESKLEEAREIIISLG